MSTLINIAIALVASMLTIAGVPLDTANAPESKVIQCQQSIECANLDLITENEQLSQKIN